MGCGMKAGIKERSSINQEAGNASNPSHRRKNLSSAGAGSRSAPNNIKSEIAAAQIHTPQITAEIFDLTISFPHPCEYQFLQSTDTPLLWENPPITRLEWLNHRRPH